VPFMRGNRRHGSGGRRQSSIPQTRSFFFMFADGLQPNGSTRESARWVSGMDVVRQAQKGAPRFARRRVTIPTNGVKVQSAILIK